jgi:hypothetical protein
MPGWVKGLLTVLVATGLGALSFFLLNLPWRLEANGPIDHGVAALVGAGFGFLYGLEAGLLVSYDLGGIGWLQLVIDMTWSLPNTVWGFVIGNLIFPWFASPSRQVSRDQGFIAFMPRGSGRFGNSVLQTHGTVNLGGAGQHELVHVLQARIFGPLFLPIYAVNYVINFFIQVLFTLTIGMILWRTGARDTPYFRPPAASVVSGFFGWIYYATVFELWGYNS